MTASTLATRRLHAQHVTVLRLPTPVAVVAHLGAIQAQDYASALWAIAVRTANATRADVERAIADRAIVRTWPMRGTLHFVAAGDARWMLELLAPRAQRSVAGLFRKLELDADTFTRCRAIITRALKREPVLARSALLAALDRGGVPTTGLRGIHILRHLCMDRMLCLGAHAGTQPTFTLFDDWLPGAGSRDRDDALRAIAERYFTSHGPATLRDFVWWTGLTVTDARIALELAKPALETMRVDNAELWMAPGLADAPPATQRTHLLPGFDETLLGYTDRSAMLAPEHAAVVGPGKNGIFKAIAVLDARVCGTWTRTSGASSTSIAITPLARLSAAKRALFAQPMNRYAEYLGTPVSLAPA
jgi:hypothetical protein